MSKAPIDRALAWVALAEPAISGNQGHNKTFRVAVSLRDGFGLELEEVFHCLKAYNERCQPPWSEWELKHKANEAVRKCPCPSRRKLGSGLGSAPMVLPTREATHSLPREKPIEEAPDYVKRQLAKLEGFTCTEADVIARSPIPIPSALPDSSAPILQALYEPGELVNIVTDCQIAPSGKAKPKGHGITMTREAWIQQLSRGPLACGLGGAWLRMNPVDGQGIGDSNVTAFRFALFEFDGIPLETQLPFIAKMEFPVAAILTSGGGSVHAWLKINRGNAAAYEQRVLSLHLLLGHYGADPQNKNASRLSRMPGVVRSIGGRNGGAQRLLYLNPNPSERSVL